MKAEAVMTSPVTTIDVDAPLLDALRLMTDLAISGLPVVDASGKLVGMLTEGDLLRRSEIGSSINRPRWLEYLLGSARQAREYVAANSRAVKDLMTDRPVTVGPDAGLDEVAGLMLSGQVKRLPVVRDGAVVGIVGRLRPAASAGRTARGRPERRAALRPRDPAAPECRTPEGALGPHRHGARHGRRRRRRTLRRGLPRPRAPCPQGRGDEDPRRQIGAGPAVAGPADHRANAPTRPRRIALQSIPRAVFQAARRAAVAAGMQSMLNDRSAGKPAPPKTPPGSRVALAIALLETQMEAGQPRHAGRQEVR